MKVSRTRKEKLETGTDASLQIVTANATEESTVTATSPSTSNEYSGNTLSHMEPSRLKSFLY
jgi:hypothetical protein